MFEFHSVRLCYTCCTYGMEAVYHFHLTNAPHWPSAMFSISRPRHGMGTFFALLALCDVWFGLGLDFRYKGPVIRNFDVFYDAILYKRSNCSITDGNLSHHDVHEMLLLCATYNELTNHCHISTNVCTFSSWWTLLMVIICHFLELNTWLHWMERKQLQEDTRNI